jgi:hypothetical protein
MWTTHLADIPSMMRRYSAAVAAWLRPRAPEAKGRMAEQVFSSKPAPANDHDNSRLAA